LVQRLKSGNTPCHVMDRCNLTVLFEPGQDDLAAFLAAHEVEIVASLPCYSVENVDQQRGAGVFDKSIRALQMLNDLGYGTDAKLKLNLVYNPVGALLPGAQSELEAAYKAELESHFGIVFDNLYTITNMPIARFAAFLQRSGKWHEYSQLLLDAFNPGAVYGLMCRDTISVGWRGEVYDCDFNQMLNMQWRNGKPLHLWDVNPTHIAEQPILTGTHCFGCTAGAGSSCGGATVQ
jgi:radical SAM/Cys-rich protein